MKRSDLDNRPVIIRVAENKVERKRAGDFIAEVFLQYYGTRPGPCQILFGAYHNSTIVGSIGIDFADTVKSLPFEKMYECDLRALSPPLVREKTVQLGRWATQMKDISEVLFYAAVVYALNHGKENGCFVAKEAIAQRLLEFGMILYPAPKLRLREENVPKEDRQYYFSYPFPQFYSIMLKQIENVLRPKIFLRIKSGEIVLEIT